MRASMHHKAAGFEFFYSDVAQYLLIFGALDWRSRFKNFSKIGSFFQLETPRGASAS